MICRLLVNFLAAMVQLKLVAKLGGCTTFLSSRNSVDDYVAQTWSISHH